MKSKLLAIIAIAVLSAALSNAVAAEAPQWFLDAIKVDNPNQLAVYTYADEECPFTTEDLKTIVSGVFIRSRVKPLTGWEWASDDLHLGVELTCIKMRDQTDRFIYRIDLQYGNYSVVPRIQYSHDYGYLGLANKASIIMILKNKVEAAITDFIKANFDL